MFHISHRRTYQRHSVPRSSPTVTTTKRNNPYAHTLQSFISIRWRQFLGERRSSRIIIFSSHKLFTSSKHHSATHFALATRICLMQFLHPLPERKASTIHRPLLTDCVRRRKRDSSQGGSGVLEVGTLLRK